MFVAILVSQPSTYLPAHLQLGAWCCCWRFRRYLRPFIASLQPSRRIQTDGRSTIARRYNGKHNTITLHNAEAFSGQLDHNWRRMSDNRRATHCDTLGLPDAKDRLAQPALGGIPSDVWCDDRVRQREQRVVL
jgi:hypothetical protein